MPSKRKDFAGEVCYIFFLLGIIDEKSHLNIFYVLLVVNES